MSKDEDLARLGRTGIVAIIRTPSSERLVDVAEALLAGGVEAVEVTFTVPGAARVLEQVAERLGDRVLLGAGTILDAQTARIAMLAGARFVVSPNVNVDVIQICRRHGALAIPGGFTPTEILTAWERGADVVKVFPSDFTGAAYLKVLAGPLPHVRLMPTGGVTLESAPAFLKAGAFAVGIGTALVDPALVAAGNLKRIEELARGFVEVVRQTRASASG